MDRLEELVSILGEDKVFTDPFDLTSHSVDPGRIRGHAEAVVRAESVDDVIATVKFCRRHKIPLTPQGALSSLTGSAIPFGGIVLDLQKMCGIEEINVEDGYVVVEPGLRIEELNEELKKQGFYFPVDPTSSAVATIGGAIASGAGGIRGAKFGTVRDWTLGLDVVIGTGDLIKVGCRTVKCRQGYDLTRLFVGSEGTLGVIVKAILQIYPIPEAVNRVVAFFSDYRDGVRAVREIKRARIVPLAMEFMDRATMDLVSKFVEFDVPKRCEFALIVDVDAPKESIERISKYVERILRACGAVVTSSDLSREDIEKIFVMRKSATSTIIRESRLASFSEDVTVPPSKLPELMAEIYGMGKKYGVKIFVFGHIADGNIHPRIAIDSEEDFERAKDFFKEIGIKAIELGGTTSGEHGIGITKKDLLRYEFESRGSPIALEIMRKIKEIFDPDNIMNPGKII